jgi:hypothetical protein
VSVAVPEAPAVREHRPLTTTERNWLWALAIVVGSGLVFGGVLALEKAGGLVEKRSRLVWDASETSMRFLALSHFLVALVFTTTSKRMKRPSSWGIFLGLASLGALLCVGFSRIGGIGAPLAAVLFYAYFLVHEFRDQVGFYRANGDAPAGEDPKAMLRDLLVFPALAFAVIGAVFVFAGAFEIGGARRYVSAFGDVPAYLRQAIGVVAVLAALALVVATKRRYDRRFEGGVASFLATHRPILFVFAGIVAVLFLGIPLTGRVYPIVTLHVTAWYVFYVHMLRSRPRAAPGAKPFTWTWMRSTNAGFNFVHLGIAALVIAAGAYWAYATGNDSSNTPLRLLLSKDGFPYWTIMHVTVSFLPR